jgi:hypothetical protein
MVPAIAPVREDSESALITRAQSALSRCNWEVGECAALWTKRFARGRTDADFGLLVGLSADQVFQRRRVWETFGDVSENFPALKWSHFYSALNWDDAAECLQWAEDVQAGVAEMKAWRRAQRGEDLSETATDEPFSLAPAELTLVGEAAPFDAASPRLASNSEGRQLATLAAGGTPVNSESSYAPFREDAAMPAARDEAPRPEPTTEQLVKRMTTAIERCHGAMTLQFCRQFAKLPENTRLRFLKSVEQLSAKTTALSE